MLTALKGSQLLFLFTITAGGIVTSGGPKKSTRTSSTVQIIFSFWFFEISEGILRNQQIHYWFRFILLPTLYIFGSVWIILVFVSTILMKVAKLQYFTLTEEA